MTTLTTIDSGILKTFRNFTGIRLCLYVFACAIYILGSGGIALREWLILGGMLLEASLLPFYLSLAFLKSLMKGTYLPVGLIWATVGPILELHIFFLFFFTETRPTPSAILLLFQSILVVFIPLIIISWQYSIRAVWIYSGLTFFLDALLITAAFALSIVTPQNLTIYPPIMGAAFTRTVVFLLVGNMITNLVTVQREQHREMIKANRKLAQHAATVEQLAISRERNRVARELHDVLAHTMSGVAVELEGVRTMMDVDTSHAQELLSRSLGAIREGLSEARRALQALRASPLEDLGLALAICNLVNTTAGPAGLEIEVQVDHEIPDYPKEVQQSVYRIVEESLTNVVLHAEASRVKVQLQREGFGVKLLIEDNGIGFDMDVIDIERKYGLMGIRERAEMIHGRVTIESKVGGGTKIFLVYEPTDMEENNG
jgi:signal transduction histidine kinase